MKALLRTALLLWAALATGVANAILCGTYFDSFVANSFCSDVHIDSRGQAFLDSASSPTGVVDADNANGFVIIGLGANNAAAIGNGSGGYAAVGNGAMGVVVGGFPNGSGVTVTVDMLVQVSFSESGPMNTWVTLDNHIDMDIDGTSSVEGDPCNLLAVTDALSFNAQIAMSEQNLSSGSELPLISPYAQNVRVSLPANCNGAPAAGFLTQFPYHFSLDFPVSATYHDYTFAFALDASANGGDSLTAARTALISFNLAPGVTMDNPFFLSTPGDINLPGGGGTAPEPATLSLFGTALALGFLRKRKSPQPGV
ncbi:MAG TPA: PEP-CTERM sorting domain-containing protein [Casimicrobiaceae bacterium]|nr:PEP-CTERM sorting domain-containing protein [Casimicrobiaceae bacterium]